MNYQISLIPDTAEEDNGSIRNLKAEILEVSKRVIDASGKLLLNHYRKDFQFLFDIYNYFIAPDHKPEKTTCSYCRMKVLNFFKVYVQTKEANQ